MLPPTQSDCLEVILVSPRNPLNIGAAARAMANFGFHRLSIVAPYAQNWMEAKSAVGAPSLLREAKVFPALAEAVAHCTLVIGTGSLDRRRPEQAILNLPQAAAYIRDTLALSPESTARPARVALLFGSEKHGLTTEDLSWCHALTVIETCDEQPSMNLGQAVAVCLYEITRNPPITRIPPPEKSSSTALKALKSFRRPEAPESESGQLDRLAALIEETMAAVNYSTRGMRSANGGALRILLRRLMPKEADLRRMMGLFRRILWQIRRRIGSP